MVLEQRGSGKSLVTAMYKQMKTAIESAQQVTSHCLSNKKLKGLTLEREDKVYLSTKNLHLK